MLGPGKSDRRDNVVHSFPFFSDAPTSEREIWRPIEKNGMERPSAKLRTWIGVLENGKGRHTNKDRAKDDEGEDRLERGGK